MDTQRAPEKITKLLIELPQEKHHKLRVAAAIRGMTMKGVIMECIERLPDPPQPSRTTETRAEYET